MSKTIVMIHGMWGGAWYWERFSDFFTNRGYDCVVPTLRHHDAEPGTQPEPALGGTGLLDYAGDLDELIQDLGEKPIIMGHSMGGLLTQILGSRGLARALVLMTPAPPYGIMALRPSVIRSFWSALTRWEFWKRPHRPTFDEAVYAMLHLLPPEEKRATYDRFVHEAGRAAAEIGFWMFDRKKAAQVDEEKIEVPMLIIGGSQDRITPATVTRNIADKYASVATYREFPGHAHWIMAEPGWDEVAEYVSGWLEVNLTG